MKRCSIQECERKHCAKGYCEFHYHRWQRGKPLLGPHGNKGKNNCNWSGGNSGYPNHYEMKKNRCVKIEQTKGTCELCPRKGETIHHIDKDKSNHSLGNLLFICRKCHGKLHRGYKTKTSIWMRRYGLKQKELCEKLRCSYSTLVKWHSENLVKQYLGLK